MTEFPASMIHPDALKMLSATALFTAPIDLEAAVTRVGTLQNESITSEWEEGGSILRFALRDAAVLLSPVPGEAVPEGGRLPTHGFHIALTCLAPVQDVGGFGAGAGSFGPGVDGPRRENGGSGGEFGDRAVEAGGSGIPGFTNEEIAELEGLPHETGLRRRAPTAHVVLTKVTDALMREKSAVGLFRPKLGVVQPPWITVELADLLNKGQAPIPLWAGIRVSKPDLIYGRALGLPLFGHLDLKVVESLHSEKEVYAMLSNVVDYLLSADALLSPGQSIGYCDGKDLTISQAASPADRAAVLHIGFQDSFQSGSGLWPLCAGGLRAGLAVGEPSFLPAVVSVCRRVSDDDRAERSGLAGIAVFYVWRRWWHTRGHCAVGVAAVWRVMRGWCRRRLQVEVVGGGYAAGVEAASSDVLQRLAS